MSLSRGEKETIVRFSEDQEEPMTVYTHRAKLAERCERLGGKLKYTNKLEGRIVAWCYELPREYFKGPSRKRKVTLTDEHRERLRNARPRRQEPPAATIPEDNG
jgi:hypothetical protein